MPPWKAAAVSFDDSVPLLYGSCGLVHIHLSTIYKTPCQQQRCKICKTWSLASEGSWLVSLNDSVLFGGPTNLQAPGGQRTGPLCPHIHPTEPPAGCLASGALSKFVHVKLTQGPRAVDILVG